MKWFLIVLLPIFLSAQTPLKTYVQDEIEVKSFRFDEFKSYLEHDSDQVYIVNFWATWCAPCIKELPVFEAINAKYGDTVKMVLVSLDFTAQVEKALIPFIKKKGLKAEVIHLVSTDANEWVSKVNPNWSGAIPATVIYKGEKRQFYERSFTQDELEQELKSFINQ